MTIMIDIQILVFIGMVALCEAVRPGLQVQMPVF